MIPLAGRYRTHTCGELRAAEVAADGEDPREVRLAGHVQGEVVDGRLWLRDFYGRTLVLADPHGPPPTLDRMRRLGPEDVVQVTGVVVRRPEDEVDGELPTGGVQVLARAVEVLSRASGVPEALLGGDPEALSLEDRLTFRQLYLRRPDVQARMRLRSEIAAAVRSYLVEQGFLEVETPHLFWYDPVAIDPEPVPAGPGRAFALPSGPVVLNQYVKGGQLDRTFQLCRITRRDEARSPMHTPEYTGLDLNLCYVDVEDFYRMVEGLMTHVAKEVLGHELETPFPRFSFEDAFARFGSDKPDLRTDEDRSPRFCWVHSYPYLREDERGDLVPDVVVFSRPLDEDLEKVFDERERSKARARAFDLVLDGVEVASAYIGNHHLELQRHIWRELFQMDNPDLFRLRAPIESHRFGLPPHGGMTIGFDRLVAGLVGADALDEVIPFPKDPDCRDPFLDAPGPVPEEAASALVGERPQGFDLDDLNEEMVQL